MFERYTEKARRVIFFARYEASEYASPYIETEHILLGIARECRYLLRTLAPDAPEDFYAKWRAQLEPFRSPKTSTSVDLPLSNESKRVVAFAAEEAERMHDRHIGVEHEVLALLRERHNACQMLESIGITLKRAREHFATHSYAPTPTTTQSAEGLVGAGAGCSRHATGIPFVQFVDKVSGEHVGVVPVGGMAHLPRVGDYVQLDGADGVRGFKVMEIKHVFERTEQRWPYRDHELTKIVVTVQGVKHTAE